MSIIFLVSESSRRISTERITPKNPIREMHTLKSRFAPATRKAQ
jgi:hypothetical protein